MDQGCSYRFVGLQSHTGGQTDIRQGTSSREIVTNIRDDMQKFVNNREQQLGKLRLKRYEEDKKRRLALNPSEGMPIS